MTNLVVFDPTTGALRQVVDLATTISGIGPLLDSTGSPVPGDAFVQAFVRTSLVERSTVAPRVVEDRRPAGREVASA